VIDVYQRPSLLTLSKLSLSHVFFFAAHLPQD